MNEQDIEKMLKIKTTGRDDSNSDLINYPYEPTSYDVLKELVDSELLCKDDVVVDYGSGKGRVAFYLADYLKCSVKGIENDERLFNRSISNLETSKINNVSFVNNCASRFGISDDVTAAYFFNPFSIFILKLVLNNIKKSLKRNERQFRLFFYYPSTTYLELLEREGLIHIKNIDCKNISNDSREYIGVYEIVLEIEDTIYH